MSSTGPREARALRLELGDRGRDVVAHRATIQWWRGCECSSPSQVYDVGCTPSSLGPVLKMSQPGTLGLLDERPAEHVAEERPRRLGVVRVDERVDGVDHRGAIVSDG